MKKIKVISLFSGCGGLDLGFKKEGFEIVYANDNEKSVKETYEKNLGHSLDSTDIRLVEKSKIPYGDIILAEFLASLFKRRKKGVNNERKRKLI